MDFIKDIAKAAVDSVGASGDMSNDTRAIGDIPILSKLVDFFLDSSKGQLREVVQKEVTKCRDLTVTGIAAAIKDIFELTTKLFNGQLDLSGSDGQKILNIAAQILGGSSISSAITNSGSTNTSNNTAATQDYQMAPAQPQQNYQQQQPQQQQQQYGYAAQQQQPQQQQYGYAAQQQQPQQQQYGYAAQQQQQQYGYAAQQQQDQAQAGRGVDANQAGDRGILQDIGNMVKNEISDMANGSNGSINISNILNCGLDANNLREAATPLISNSFKDVMEKAESGVTDLITDGIINGVKSYLNINTKVKDIAGNGGFDLSSLASLFGSNDNLSRDVESNDRALNIFGVLSNKVNEGLGVLREKNREIIHTEMGKVEATIWEKLPTAITTPLQTSVKEVMSEKGTLTRGFDISSVVKPIIGVLAEPAEKSLKDLYTESHRGIEDNLVQLSEDALVSRIKKYLPFLNLDKKN